MTTEAERRRTFPSDIWESLKYYANDEKQALSEDIRGMVTPEGMAWEILKNQLVKMGHYPPKTKDVGEKAINLKNLQTASPPNIEDG